MTTATPSPTVTSPVTPGVRAAPQTRAAAAAIGQGRGARRAWNLAATTVIWLTSLFVAGLWVAGGGIQALFAFDYASLNSLGRLTGLVASNLLLYQVILMARIPLFEKGFGKDGITRMHRLVGFWSFSLMIAHIALLVWGYAAQVGINPLVQLWEFVWDYPGMLLATVGTALIVIVAFTSMRTARKKLRYESWHLLHLYAYIGVGLALPHQLWTGADFLSSPLATAYWWTLWAVAAAAILVFRIGVPLARTLRHRVKVARVEPDGTGGVAVTMTGRHLASLKARSGQFFLWRFLDGPGASRANPFSLAAAPDGRTMTISARIVGDGTARLATLRPGTPVMIEGPYGVMTGAARTGRKLLMFGAGAGVAPLVALLESEPYDRGEATLITRDHAPDAALRQDAIAELVRTRGVRHVALHGTRARTGSSWLPNSHARWQGSDAIRHLAPDLDQYDVFLCGPEPWMAAVKTDLRRAGVAADRIHSESFTI
ncbi:ferric reductase-like transmembrane domain-containing protein [Microbacterium sediminicola]|uniref:Ferric reductase-like transmembrane domain-containing protein n=1 Tax=Microbacterium sediminicola TaxID=415210 RepID=A0ABP4U0G0_9MICO